MSMSLIVAQVTDAGPRVVSDTRVLLADGRRPSFRNDTLKAVIIRRDIAVCFAGDVALGLASIRSLAQMPSQELDAGIDVLLDVLHKRASGTGDVEFLVATAMPDSLLARVRREGIEKGLPAAWIGDAEAFEKFQQARHAPDPWAELNKVLPPSARVMSTLQRSMQVVIGDSALESVDAFCVAIANMPDGFQYMSSTFIHVGRDVELRPGEDLISRMAQPVEEGGYAVSVVEPAEPGTPALGLSFPRARMGMIYLPLKYDQAQVLHDVSPNEFSRVVLERFGIAMNQPLLRYADPA
jgi:hypothetical protein